MKKYKLVKSLYEDSISCIKNTETGDMIPLNSSNTDYQEYLEWAKTNTAEAAD